MDCGQTAKAAAKTSLALPKFLLLRKSGDFRRVYQKGHRIRGNRFTLIYAPNQLPHHRFGVSIHGARSAVRRNRAKRIIREWFRLNREFLFSLLPVAAEDLQYDVVLAVREGFAAETPTEVGDVLRDGLVRRRKETG